MTVLPLAIAHVAASPNSALTSVFTDSGRCDASWVVDDAQRSSVASEGPGSLTRARLKLSKGRGGLAERRGDDRLSSLTCAVLSGRPQVGVDVERRSRLRVAEEPLDGHNVATGGDQAGGVEVSEVVELDAGEAGVAQCLAPPVANCVLVRWVVALPGE